MTRKTIIKACDKVVSYPLLKARNGKTYCNFGVDGILRLLGIDCFFDDRKKRIMIANEMFDYMVGSKDWQEILWEDSIDNKGLVVLAIKAKLHGHIAVVYPTGTCKSSKWGCIVPLVANIGKENVICGANWAFSDKPKAFLYKV